MLNGEHYTPLTPEQIKEFNELGIKTMEQILDHPQKCMIQVELGRFGTVLEIYDPEGRGVRYTEKGEFLGFLEPPL